MPEPLTLDERRDVALAQVSYLYFLEKIFARSFDGQMFMQADGSRGPFKLGQVHREWAVIAQMFKDICILAPRLHLKSTILGRGVMMWQMFRAKGYQDGLYFSYKDELAGEHVAELKRMIEANPYCRHWVNKSPMSKTSIDFFVDWGDGPVAEVEVQGVGIFGATRGRHPRLAVVCDDIISDFANPLNPTELRHIERIVRSVILSLPTADCPMVVVGTPQAFDDILFGLGQAGEDDNPEEGSLPPSSEFYWDAYPAIRNSAKRITLWPEVYGWDRLQKIRRRVKKAFPTEYLLSPVAEEEAFVPMSDLLEVTDPDLVPVSLEKPFANPGNLGVYAGIDVGKMVHPTHITILLETPDRDLVTIFEEFLDHLKYPDQVARINQLAVHFNLTRGYYDSTYNVLDDRGLTKKIQGRRFSKKLKADLATGLEKRVYAAEGEPGLVLLPHQRFLGQVACVSNRLQSPVTVMGHGDAFWSLSLAIKAAQDGPRMIDMGAPTPGSRSSRQAMLRQLQGART